jgi:uncharacterized UBP type Zn finger protein
LIFQFRDTLGKWGIFSQVPRVRLNDQPTSSLLSNLRTTIFAENSTIHRMAQCEILCPLPRKLLSPIPLQRPVAYCTDHLPPEFFSSDHALEYFNTGSPKHPLGGLVNIGYNCYMNAVTQSLAYTPGFAQFCLDLPNGMYQANATTAFFLDSFGHIFSQLNYKKSVCPDWLLTDKALIHPQFQGVKQEDSHEFLIKLLARFDDECFAALSQPDESTFISHFFKWQVRTTITCENCHSETENAVECFDWTIPICQSSDLGQILETYTSGQPAHLQCPCEHCMNCSLVRTDHIDNYPLILIATMLRFDNDLRKIDDFMAYPEVLHLRGGDYELYSIIVHEGKVISHGHFLSYVKDENRNWHKADDLTVFKSKSETALGMKPYILFYKRIM